MTEQGAQSKLFSFSSGLIDTYDPFDEQSKDSVYDGINFRINNGTLITNDLCMTQREVKGSLLPFISDESHYMDNWICSNFSGASNPNCVFVIKSSGFPAQINTMYAPVYRTSAATHASGAGLQGFIRFRDETINATSASTYGFGPLSWTGSSYITTSWKTIGAAGGYYIFDDFDGVGSTQNVFLKQLDIIGFLVSGIGVAVGRDILFSYYCLASGEKSTYGAISDWDNGGGMTDVISGGWLGYNYGQDNAEFPLVPVRKYTDDSNSPVAFPGIYALNTNNDKIDQVVNWHTRDHNFLVIVSNQVVSLYDGLTGLTTFSNTSIKPLLYYSNTAPVNVATINMNDRQCLMIGGASTEPYWTWVSVIPHYLGLAPSWVSTDMCMSTMSIRFLNGTTSDASGLQLAHIFPQQFVEFKNKVHIIAPTIEYSDASGGHSEQYKLSIFPSEGYIPDVFDWNKEILLDSSDAVIAGVEFKNNLYCFTRSSIYYFSYDQEGNPTDIQILSREQGIEYRAAVCATANYLFWCNLQGAYMTDGIQWTKISQKINGLWLKKVRTLGEIEGKAVQRTVVHDAVNGLVYFSLTSFTNSANGAFAYNYKKDTWSYWNVDPVGIMPLIDRNVIICGRGNGMAQYYTNHQVLSAYNASHSPEHSYFFNVNPKTSVSKMCPLIPDYSFKADNVYTRFLVKSNWAPSQSFTIKAYWDAKQDNNMYSQVCWVDQQVYTDIPLIKPYKFSVPGSGNILYVNISRESQGDIPLEIVNIQVDYNVIERGDV